MENLHIQKIIIRNFQRIEEIDVQADGQNIILLADNDRGKSSFLNAVRAVLGDAKALSSAPLHKDAEAGYVQAFLGPDNNQYTFTLKLQKGKEPQLSVKAPDGVVHKKKSLISELVGSIDFDIWEFIKWGETESGKKKQLELVKSFLSQEEQEILAKIEKKIQDNYDQRTEVNRELERLKKSIEGTDLTFEDIQTYAKEKSIENEQEAYNKAFSYNTKIDGVNTRIEERVKEIEEAKKTEDTAIERVKELKRLLVEAEAAEADATAKHAALVKTQEDAKSWYAAAKKIDLKPLEEAVGNVSSHNAKHEKVKQHKADQVTLDGLKKQSEDLTIMVDAGREEVATLIREIGLPLDGLRFVGDRLEYNDMPLEEAVMSTSEIMMVGIQLKIARNPNAKVLCLEDGQNLGEEKLKLLLELGEKYGFQLFIEEVKRGQKELIYEFITREQLN